MSKLSRTLWASAAAISALVTASSAQAAVYSYSESGGEGLTFFNVGPATPQNPFSATFTVDTSTGKCSVIGSGVDVTFTGNFSAFTGGSSPSGTYNVTIDPTSNIVYNGNTYTLVATPTHADMIIFQGSSINLWGEWAATGCGSCQNLGDTVGNISSSSTGGTAVPEPGMVGLMGLGVLGLAFRRRLANVAGFNAQLA